MKNLKRILAGILAIAVLTAGAAFAADTKTVSINGTEIEGAQVLTSEGKTFVPVRAICETLGIEVEWDGENEIITLVKLPMYITFSPNSDGYTFAKTAPFLLGSAPIMKNDRTYVPENFVTEILHGELEISEEGNVNIVVEVQKTVPVEILEVTEGEQGIVLNVNDLNRGEEVVVNITEETVIAYDNGNEAAIDALTSGMDAKIEYAEFMTMSIPPMTNAVKIIVPAPFVAEEETEEAAKADAEVIEVSASEEGTSVTVNDSVRGEVVVNITEETVITDANGEAATVEDIKKGSVLEIEYADFMTMSLPPITNAVKIVIKGEAEIAKNASVVSVDAENKQLTVMHDEFKMEIVLNITDETSVTDKNGEAVDFTTLEKDAELYVENSEAMTRSIPPMTNAIKIVVL